MSIAENKEVIRRLFEEVVNQKNLKRTEQVVAPEHVDIVKRLILLVHTAFPDFHVTLEDQIAEDDKVAAMFTASGTHQGITTFFFEGTLPIFHSSELSSKRSVTWPASNLDTLTPTSNEQQLTTLPASWQQFSYVGVKVFRIENGKIIDYWGGWSSESERFTNWLFALHR